MNSFLSFVSAHQTLITTVSFWLFSAAMSTMPDLPTGASFGTTWTYKFLQAVAANFQKHNNPQGIPGGTDKASKSV